MDEALHRADREWLGNSSVETLHNLALHTGRTEEPERILEGLRLREVLHDELYDLLDIFLRRIDDRIRARVVRVRRLELPALLDRDAVVLDD